jgi:hypothetical protein
MTIDGLSFAAGVVLAPLIWFGLIFGGLFVRDFSWAVLVATLFSVATRYNAYRQGTLKLSHFAPWPMLRCLCINVWRLTWEPEYFRVRFSNGDEWEPYFQYRVAKLRERLNSLTKGT